MFFYVKHNCFDIDLISESNIVALKCILPYWNVPIYILANKIHKLMSSVCLEYESSQSKMTSMA